MAEEEAQQLCPICDLVHGHEVELEYRPGETPEVRCPCPKCKVENRVWNTVEEYQAWLAANIENIRMYARMKNREEEESPEDRKARVEMENLIDERMYKVQKAEEEGTWRRPSAWGKHGPPDD